MSLPRARALGAAAGYLTVRALVGHGGGGRGLYPRILKPSTHACRFVYIFRVQLLEPCVSVV